MTRGPRIDDLLRDRGAASRARFFLRVGQVGRATEPKDPYTLPLFPLLMMLEHDGLLAEDMNASRTED